MRSKKITATVISVLTVMVMSFMVSTTVFATDELGTLTPPVVEETYFEFEGEPEVETQPMEETEPPYEEPVETQAPVATEEQKTEEEDLPVVESHEVVKPTSVKLPDVEVTDTSLMGGVIAWLCVAVGIAVIAGVLVSQRTRQVSSSTRNDRRR